ncbi:aqualysin-1-like [Amphiura filiformis]|uniref:aqualysin-1-like n=1 Tax=Amphiura filiformis TaxID=82378 RepID=UPI003B2228B9
MRAFVFAVLLAVATADLAPLFKMENKIPGEYLVVMKEETLYDDFLKGELSKIPGINIQRHFEKVFKGFEAKMDAGGLLGVRERKDVKYVEEDSIVSFLEEAASWGLDRVDQRYLPLDGEFDITGTGEGANAYIIDTGIYPDNSYFERRAEVAFDAIGDGQDGLDCNGHGTHCAGTIGSNPYGIAREASLYGVRVLDCFGSGAYSDVVAGCDWVAENGKRPAVGSMSLGGGASESMDQAIRGMHNSGVAVAVAAGNSDADACLYSPAREPLAITVGATDIDDSRAYFSNYGTCVDIFAPGVNIVSTYIGSETATASLSGTSMACPHVAGGAAVALGNNNDLTPDELVTKLVEDATTDVITDPGLGSPNKLLYVP